MSTQDPSAIPQTDLVPSNLTFFHPHQKGQQRHGQKHIQATSQASIAKDLSDRLGTLSQIHPTSSQENHHGRKPTP